MRVAWFHPTHLVESPAAVATSALIAELRRGTSIDIITQADAHAFVVEQALRPYDLCVYELSNAPGGEFIWGYLFHYPGVLVLHDHSVHDSRARAFERHRRHEHYAAEFAFNHRHPPRAAAERFPRGSWPMLRAPLLASRLVVVSDKERRHELASAWPDIDFRYVGFCAAAPVRQPVDSSEASDDVVWVAAVGGGSREAVERPIARAQLAGANVALLSPELDGRIRARAEIVVALDVSSDEASAVPALAAMAAGTAVIVSERQITAAWPAYDPQTWRARDPLARTEPVVVSIDPRDEAHSLMLALHGLARSPARRDALGTAARAWWRAYATPARAASEWQLVLEDAVRTSPAPLPADWPAHLRMDGLESARTVAAEMGVDVADLW